MATGQEIVDEIKGIRNAGRFAEGWIGAANEEMEDARSQLKAGDIDQDQYMEILGEVVPFAMDIYRKAAQSGSAGASATAVPGQRLVNEYYNEYIPQRDAQDLLGRYLKPEELARIKPTYATDGELAGRARMADLFEREKEEPEIVAPPVIQPPDEGEPVDTGDGEEPAADRRGTPEWAGRKATDIFQNVLGRDPNDDELQHYGSLLIREDAPFSAYELGQALKQTDEFRKAQDVEFRGEVASELEAPTQEFVEKATPGILAKYQRAGTLGSSGLDFAITNMLEDLAKNREQYLGGLTVSQYGGRKDLARQDYLNQLNQLAGEGAYLRGRGDFLSDAYRQRFFDVSDYNRQRQDYQDYLNSLGGQGGSSFADFLPLVGTAAGAATGNPQWAMAGNLFGQAGQPFFR